MIFPLNMNKVEQLYFDPAKKINGYIWFNKVEKVYKTWVDDELNVFVTDKSLESLPILDNAISTHQFTVAFEEAYRVIIKHNKNTLFFNYSVYDEDENCNLPCE